MADLRSKFIEDYAGGLLNVSRQELSSTGEVLSQDGLLSDSSIFVEDGSGSKSGLKLGVSICEVVDPTTPQGAVSVRYADRTYASTRDLKIFSTALASAQAALSDATASSITNLENAFQLLETAQDTLQSTFSSRKDIVDGQLEKLEEISTLSAEVSRLGETQEALRATLTSFVTQDEVVNTSRFYTSTGNTVRASIVQFYKTRGEKPNDNGSLRRQDELGKIEFAGNDGNAKTIGSSICAIASSSWDSEERGTYIGFNWVGTDQTTNSITPTEWISFGKPVNIDDEIGPRTITFASPPLSEAGTILRSNVSINGSGQIVKSLTPSITVSELKTALNAADYATFKAAVLALID
jgi:hypothetical protein